MRTLLLLITGIIFTVFASKPLLAQQDTVPPVITLTGGSKIYQQVGFVFKDPGITITDNVDTITDYDTSSLLYSYLTPGSRASELGIYGIEYTAVDKSNNVAKAIRVVEVFDTIKPVAFLVGDSIVCVEQGSPFTDAGVDHTDNYYTDSADFMVEFFGCNGDFTFNDLGTFKYRYRVTDPSGNSSYSGWRYVIVRSQGDTSPCVLLDSLKDTCQILVGIAHKEHSPLSIRIYPNPASGKVILETGQAMNARVRLFDPAGRCVLDKRHDLDGIGRAELDISALPKGLYFMEVLNPATGARAVERLEVMR